MSYHELPSELSRIRPGFPRKRHQKPSKIFARRGCATGLPRWQGMTFAILLLCRSILFCPFPLKALGLIGPNKLCGGSKQLLGKVPEGSRCSDVGDTASVYCCCLPCNSTPVAKKRPQAQEDARASSRSGQRKLSSCLAYPNP